jgi:hypothetical protein
MPGHGGIRFVSSGAPNAGSQAISNVESFENLICGHCGTSVSSSVIALTHEKDVPEVKWLRCPACHKGMVLNEGQLSPSSAVGDAVEGLPADTAEAYEEARRAASFAAYTACELMCRKILMHVAVDKGAPAGKPFTVYLDHLVQEGYLTPPMKPWVDVIRKRGNIATHEIPSSNREQAVGTLTFTTQLLRLVYEMAFKVKNSLPAPPTENLNDSQ